MWYLIGVIGFLIMYFLTNPYFAYAFLAIILFFEILNEWLSERLRDNGRLIISGVGFLYFLISYFYINQNNFLQDVLFVFTTAFFLIVSFSRPPKDLLKYMISGVAVLLFIVVVPLNQINAFVYNLNDVSFQQRMFLMSDLVRDYLSNITRVSTSLDDSKVNSEKSSFDPKRYVKIPSDFPVLEVSYDDELVYPSLQVSLSFSAGDLGRGMLKSVKAGIYNGILMNAYGSKCKDKSYCLFEKDSISSNEKWYEFASFELNKCNFDDYFYSKMEFIGATQTNINYYLGSFDKVSMPDISGGLAGTVVELLPKNYEYPGKGDAEFLLRFVPFVVDQKSEDEAFIPFIKVIVPYYVNFESTETCIVESEESQEDVKAYVLKVERSCIRDDAISSFVCRVVVPESVVREKKGSIMSIIVITPYKYYGVNKHFFELKDQPKSCDSSSEWHDFFRNYFTNVRIESSKYYVVYARAGKLSVPFDTALTALMDKCMEMYDGLNGNHNCFYVSFSAEDAVSINSEETTKSSNEEALSLPDESKVNIKNEKIYVIYNDAKDKQGEYAIRIHHEKHCSVDKVVAVIS